MAVAAAKIIVDVCLFLAVTIPFAVLELASSPNTPFKRGFYCDDESIRYPYKGDTITDPVLVIVCTLPIVITIFIVEWLLYKHGTGQDNRFEPVYNRTEVRKRSFHPYAVALYCTIGPFALGIMTIGLLTDAAKFLIGRLRPHFISVCDPDFSEIACRDSYGNPLYVLNYTCMGTDDSKLKDMRLSFPSGHASLSFFAFVYFALYLQYRMAWRFSLLLKPFLQLCGMMFAFMCALSRVSDYKHHPTDVLAGSVLGTIVAFFIACFVSDLRNRTVQRINAMNKSSYSIPDYGTSQQSNAGFRREESVMTSTSTVPMEPDKKV